MSDREHTYWGHLWDRPIEHLLHKHRGIVVDIIHLDDKFGGLFQGPVVCFVNDEGCQLIRCLLLPVQPLEDEDVPSGLVHLEDGVGTFTLDDVFGIVVTYTGCDLEGKCNSER